MKKKKKIKKNEKKAKKKEKKEKKKRKKGEKKEKKENKEKPEKKRVEQSTQPPKKNTKNSQNQKTMSKTLFLLCLLTHLSLQVMAGCPPNMVELIGGSCAHYCPGGVTPNLQTGQCNGCDPTCLSCDGNGCNDCIWTHYLKGSYCYPCPMPSCQSAFDSSQCNLAIGCSACRGNGDTCTECYSGYALLGSTCVELCSLPGYHKNVWGQCVPCSESFGFHCTTCTLQGCSSCAPGTNLYLGQCV